jgi:hypothetical protein
MMGIGGPFRRTWASSRSEATLIAPILPAFFYLLFLGLWAYVSRRTFPFSIGVRVLHVLDGVLGLCAGFWSLLWCFLAAKTSYIGVPASENLERMLERYPWGVALCLGACIGGVAIAIRGLWLGGTSEAKPVSETSGLDA